MTCVCGGSFQCVVRECRGCRCSSPDIRHAKPFQDACRQPFFSILSPPPLKTWCLFILQRIPSRVQRSPLPLNLTTATMKIDSTLAYLLYVASVTLGVQAAPIEKRAYTGGSTANDLNSGGKFEHACWMSNYANVALSLCTCDVHLRVRAPTQFYTYRPC